MKFVKSQLFLIKPAAFENFARSSVSFKCKNSFAFCFGEQFPSGKFVFSAASNHSVDPNMKFNRCHYGSGSSRPAMRCIIIKTTAVVGSIRSSFEGKSLSHSARDNYFLIINVLTRSMCVQCMLSCCDW